MPTYNSERTLALALESVRGQHFDQDEIEILVVDAGSTDRTREIAESYGAQILENPKKLPEAAKTVGLNVARGEFGIFLDSDEVLENPDSFAERKTFLDAHPEIHNLIPTGVHASPDGPGTERYANFMGDPFSNFAYYHYNGYDRRKSMNRVFPHKEVDGALIYDFTNADYLPLYDAQGNLFRMSWVRECFRRYAREAGIADPEHAEIEADFTSSLFAQTAEAAGCCGMLQNDFCCHRNGMRGDIYRSKLRWRILNNLFGSDSGVGHHTREAGHKMLRVRQLLWVVYSGLILPVLIDAIRLAIQNRDAYFLTHFLWNEYILLMILWYSFCKIAHIQVKRERVYGKPGKRYT